MLKPAILYRDEIFAKLLEYSYTDNMLFYMGCLGNELPTIEENNSGNIYQYAIIGKDNKLIGYFAYAIDWYSSCAYNFGLFAFDRNNTTIGFDVYKELKKIINDYHIHRMEWRMVQGNPVERHYDNYFKHYNGKKFVFTDFLKDRRGKYHNEVIYEIIFNKSESESK